MRTRYEEREWTREKHHHCCYNILVMRKTRIRSITKRKENLEVESVRVKALGSGGLESLAVDSPGLYRLGVLAQAIHEAARCRSVRYLEQ